MSKIRAGSLARGSSVIGAAVACGLLVSACSSGSAATSSGGAATSSGGAATSSGGAASSSGGAKSVVFIAGITGSPFYDALSCGAKTEAAKLGIGYSYQAPADFTPALQEPILTSAVATKPTAILIAPTDAQAMISPITSAKATGVTMVTVDTTIKDPASVASAVNTNNEAGGALAADTMAKAIGNKGTVVALSEKPGISSDDARLAGFENEMKKYPNIKLLPPQLLSSPSATEAASKVTSVIAANPGLSAVFATDNYTGQGAPIGVKNAGAQGKVKVVGFDAQPSQVQALLNGSLYAVISQTPFQMGVTGVENAIAAADGKTVQKQVTTPLTVVTKANYKDAAVQSFIYKSC